MKGAKPMSSTFEQQKKAAALLQLKSAPTPQHGRKTDPSAAKIVETRTFQPRPGH
jgi:hypothetical protein